MAQTTVGIRELKARLSSYLRQVKGGAIVVITDRGKPIGRIVPTSLSVEAVEKEVVLTPRQEALCREMDYFAKIHSSLVSRYLGQYVAILDGQIVDADPDRVCIWRRVEAQYSDRPVFITRVRSEPLPPLRFVSTRLELE